MQTDEAIIYVAGNPDLYPLEYFDEDSQTYQGAIPAFLEQFAQEYGYELRYFQPGSEDRREHLAANQQVDLIFGCGEGEQYENTVKEPLLLFDAATEGEEREQTAFFTQTAPDQFQSELREYAAQYTQEMWTGSLLQAAADSSAKPVSTGALWGLGAAALLLALALALALGRLWRAKKKAAAVSARDPETGLGTEEALKQAFAHLERDQSRRFYDLIYFYLNLDHIGFLWGQKQTGDFLLYAAETLRQTAGPADVVTRAGGNLIVLKRFENQKEAEAWTGAAVEKICAFPFARGHLGFEDVSGGICPLEGEYQDLSQILFHARLCALTASREKTGFRLCWTDQCRKCRERWLLSEDFDQGLEREEFQLCLQFFVDAHTFRVVGGEALSRWKHPRLGLLGPDRYIPLLEGEGRIGELDFYGLEKTCVFLEKLERQGVRNFFISCNFARKTVSAPDFANRFEEIISRYSFLRKLLILEVTESQWVGGDERKQMLRNIMEIRRQGARVIFDDFGMGFSSFHDLQDYPTDGLKLDKELVDNMETEQGKIILKALIEAGHRLGLTILAEGVETDRQIELLQKLRCDVLQGFRFSVPLPAAEAGKRILEEMKQ